AMTIASTPPSKKSSGLAATAAPSGLATSTARNGSASARKSETPSSLLSVSAWRAPIRPTPTTPIRSGAATDMDTPTVRARGVRRQRSKENDSNSARFALASKVVRLGFTMGYAPPGTSPLELIGLAQEAERLGYDSAWAAEAWGTDAVTVLSWLAATTSTIKVGSAIMQIPGRTPANTAMTAATLDLLSGGRFLLGLGTSGPQVVEGWHGQPWGKPLGKTREYVEIVRTALRRDVVAHAGEHYRIPWDGQGATGLGKPLTLMLRPLRAEIPIYLAALGPKNVALAAEIADGWLPIFVDPERFGDAFGASLAAAPPDFEIAATASVLVGDDVEALRDALRPHVALYVGGMG